MKEEQSSGGTAFMIALCLILISGGFIESMRQKSTIITLTNRIAALESRQEGEARP